MHQTREASIEVVLLVFFTLLTEMQAAFTGDKKEVK